MRMYVVAGWCSELDLEGVGIGAGLHFATFARTSFFRLSATRAKNSPSERLFLRSMEMQGTVIPV